MLWVDGWVGGRGDLPMAHQKDNQVKVSSCFCLVGVGGWVGGWVGRFGMGKRGRFTTAKRIEHSSTHPPTYPPTFRDA